MGGLVGVGVIVVIDLVVVEFMVLMVCFVLSNLCRLVCSCFDKIVSVVVIRKIVLKR